MNKLKYLLAIFFGKLSGVLLKILNRNIPYYPGYIALKICPDFLKYVKKPKLIIAVTGTNGKSTICGLLKDCLENLGLNVINNNGFNIDTGIAAMFLKSKGHVDAAIIEVDEKTSGDIFLNVKPNYLICTNLFRDSMKTNSSIDYILEKIENGIPKDTKLILNADDLLTCQLAKRNNAIYFGIKENLGKNIEHRFCDLIYCPNCGKKLKFNDQKYYHIGNVSCPNCGLTNPNRDYIAAIDFYKQKLVINGNSFPLKVSSIFNIYNYIAVISTLLEIGYKAENISKCLEKIKITDSRFSEEKIGNITLINHMAKGQNPVACSSVLEYLKNEHGQKCVMLMLDDVTDNRYSSETVAWYYDTDFELLNDDSITSIIIGGKRCKDIFVRLLLAGIKKDIITIVENELDMAKYLKSKKFDKIFILHDLTSYEQSLILKNKIIKELSK